jgi:hypothetical protein
MRNAVTGDRLIALFLFGLLLLMPPMMGIFNVGTLVLGIPLLYLYLFVVWMLVVLLVALILRNGTEAGDDGGPGSDGG